MELLLPHSGALASEGESPVPVFCGAAGLVVAYSATAVVSATLLRLPASLIPRVDEIAIDRTVLLFSLALSLLAGVAFGVFPALAAYRVGTGRAKFYGTAAQPD